MTATTPPGWAADVLCFWFEDCAPEQWFKRDDAFDQTLRQRFRDLHANVGALPDDACLANADTALAATIVLDQFSRNIFRGTPAAFVQGLYHDVLQRDVVGNEADSWIQMAADPNQRAVVVAGILGGTEANTIALQNLYNDLLRQSWGGSYVLRIEDTDRARSTPEAIQAIFDGLAFLEIDWDGEVVYQFARMARHAEVAKEMMAKGDAYFAYETPEELARMRQHLMRGEKPPPLVDQLSG